MKELQCVLKDSQRPVMAELTKQLKSALGERMTREQQEAATVFYGTLCKMMMDIFGYLPAEEQSRILVNCQMWLDVGLLIGKSPQKLVEILDAANAELGTFSVPDWVSWQLESEAEK
jgi:hypothetical protein